MSKRTFKLTFVFAIALSAIGTVSMAARVDEASPAALGKRIELFFAVQDSAALKEEYDFDSFFDRATFNINLTDSWKSAIHSDSTRQKMVDALVKSTGSIADYHFLRIRQVNGETRILCRLIGTNGGLNYHDWTVGVGSGGRARIIDFYSATVGENQSETVRRICAISADPTKNEGLKIFLQCLNDVTDHKFREALADYRRIPGDMRNEKTAMLARCMSLSYVFDQPAEYTAAVAEFERLFPGDPSLELFKLSLARDGKRFADARQCIDHLERFTGGDAYLHYQRALIDALENGPGDLDRAKAEDEAAIAAEPTLHEPYWNWVLVATKQRDFDGAVRMLDRIRQALHIGIGDLTKFPQYHDLAESDAYKAWRQRQPTTKPQ